MSKKQGRHGLFHAVKRTVGLFLLWTLGLDSGAWASAMAPTEILSRCDRARGNLEGIVWELTIETKEADRQEHRFLEIKAKAFDFLAHTTDPPKVKGQKLLMVDHNMWFYKPGLSKPVPISPRQKLMGGASYGDIAATNYAEDYDATLVGEETLDGESCAVFDLKARHKKVTYDRILYWVSKKRVVGVQAHYFTLSGKLFKKARFEYAHQLPTPEGTQPFISKMTIMEVVAPDAVTHLHFGHPRLVAIAPATFNLNLLRSP
ncbi:outer membrane lipoprotein-sorting protein [Desulfosoma sp.]